MKRYELTDDQAEIIHKAIDLLQKNYDCSSSRDFNRRPDYDEEKKLYSEVVQWAKYVVSILNK